MIREVSCKAFESLQAILERKGLTLEELTSGAPVSASHLRDKNGWLAWDVFAGLLRRMEELCHDDALDAAVANEFLKRAPSSAVTRKVAGMLIGPERLYRFFCLHGGQILFPVVRPTIEKLPGNRLRWTLSVPPGYADAPLFFRTGHWNCVNLPTLLGLPPAAVTSSYAPGQGVYEVVVPRSSTLWFKFLGIPRHVFFSKRILDEEFQTRETELLRNYDELNRSQHALKELNANLERLVEDRTRELVARERDIVEERVRSAYAAGMAEIASEIIHNVGNTLTGASVSIDLVGRCLKESRVPKLRQAVALLERHVNEVEATRGKDEKSSKLVAYLTLLSEAIGSDHEELDAEAQRARAHIDAVVAILARQSEYARPARLQAAEEIGLDELVDELLTLEEGTLSGAGIEVRRRISTHRRVQLDRMKITRVLLKLLKFSREAMQSSPTKVLGIELDEADRRVLLRISNSGDAALPADTAAVFTPDPALCDVNGYDLHFCGNSVIEMGGTIRLDSRGEGPGAIFTLEFPTSGRRGADRLAGPS